MAATPTTHRNWNSSSFRQAATPANCLHGISTYPSTRLRPSWHFPRWRCSGFLLARWLWFLLNGCLFVTSAGLILSICPPSHRWLATILVSFFVVTAGILLVLGQPAVFAISLVIIGSCLFLRGRFLPSWRSSVDAQPRGQAPDRRLHRALSFWCRESIGATLPLPWRARRALLLSASLILRHHPRSAGWSFHSSRESHRDLEPGRQRRPQAGESTSHRRCKSANPEQHFLRRRGQI